MNSETTFSPPESEAYTPPSLSPATLIETYEDEIQNLQKSNIELKAKYRAVKSELKKRGSPKLESENRLLKKTLEKYQTDLRQLNIKVVELNKKLIMADHLNLTVPSKTKRQEIEQKNPHTNSRAILSLVPESPTRANTENSSIGAGAEALFLFSMIFAIFIAIYTTLG